MKARFPTGFLACLAIACAALPCTVAANAAGLPAAPAHAMSHGGDVAKLQDLITQYGVALNAGDVDGVTRLYAPDGVSMAPNSPPAVGQQALHDLYTGTFQAISLDITFQFAETKLLGRNWAFVRSNSTGTLKLLGSGTVVPEGNQELFILHRLNGEWKIARYSFSSSLPAAQ